MLAAIGCGRLRPCTARRLTLWNVSPAPCPCPISIPMLPAHVSWWSGVRQEKEAEALHLFCSGSHASAGGCCHERCPAPSHEQRSRPHSNAGSLSLPACYRPTSLNQAAPACAGGSLMALSSAACLASLCESAVNSNVVCKPPKRASSFRPSSPLVSPRAQSWRSRQLSSCFIPGHKCSSKCQMGPQLNIARSAALNPRPFPALCGTQGPERRASM